MEKSLAALEKKIPLVQNGYDYRTWPIVKPVGKNDFEIVMAHWEFLPEVLASAEEHLQFRARFNTLNAKGENLLTSPLFADASRNGRCLVLSWGYYEYRHLPKIGKKGQPLKSMERYPYHISLADQDYFFMAGICRQTHDVESGETLDTFSIITTEANELLAEVHNSKKRMPVILPEEEAYEWLFANDMTDQRIQELASFRIQPNKLKAYPVRKDFRTAADPTEPFHYPELPAIAI